ncbi:uncharacterized protein RSE6_11432 [Rhynchosporium secalis]|uniref:Uncharacterized protein n=1 Tax=Rhynchosporium secalis TaxID=38038 RepID=A0A1E1MMY7_RHYSE|nr:uncharacterized protein RSE6_11432 [Rhynchosporium secalis]
MNTDFESNMVVRAISVGLTDSTSGPAKSGEDETVAQELPAEILAAHKGQSCKASNESCVVHAPAAKTADTISTNPGSKLLPVAATGGSLKVFMRESSASDHSMDEDLPVRPTSIKKGRAECFLVSCGFHVAKAFAVAE